jgi:hypothetical protein
MKFARGPLQRITQRIPERWRRPIDVDPVAWNGAATALSIVGWFLATVTALQLALTHFAWERALGVGAAIGLTVVGALLALLLVRLLRRGPLRFWWGVFLTAGTLTIAYGLVVSPKGFAATLAAVIASAALLGGGAAMLRAKGYTRLRAAATAVGALGALVLTVAYLLPGWGQPATLAWAPQSVAALDLPNPGVAGSFAVETLSYGSGKDLHRKTFGVDAALISETVDGSHLIDGWSGLSGWARTQYWGFDAKQLPLQGRVWFPKGDGPFPLVLMVHGNHDMEDFSDPGYAYLGELFASRGIIAVSVDENFLNSSFADLLGGFKGGLEKENDARAWILLEHLRLWRQWNQDPQNRFHGKVDLDRVALIGHSRGGEAVAIAALFNRLPFYPDDARVVFDYGFNLRGVIAIAPSDEQYEPRSQATEFDDVSYLVIQGSRDGDVQSYMGSAQYSRVGFDECDTCFKAGLYLLDANHGQFNTSWGRNDLSDVWGRALNLVAIMDPEAQRNVAKVLFGAFLEVVLKDRGEYRAFLENPASGRTWLGQDVQFVNEYSAADETPIANFDEDANLTTGSTPGVHISGTGLARWYETQLPLKWNDLATESAAIGWNRTDDAKPPELRIDLDATPNHDRKLSFSLAMSDKSPLEEDADWKIPDSIDFHVVLTDRDGREASIALSSLQLLYKPIEVTTRKLAFLDAVDPSEPIFQRYAIPLQSIEGIDGRNIATMRFSFDATPAGLIYLDDIAMARDPLAGG